MDELERGSDRFKWRVSSLLKFLAILSLLLYPAQALRRTSTLNLASMRINTAELQLRESGRAVSVLEVHCRAEFEAARGGLRDSSRKVIDDPEGARQDLVKVDELLQNCFQNLSSTLHSQAYDLLTRVGQSVASAENLIDQSDVTEMKPPSQEIEEESNYEIEDDSWTPVLTSGVGDHQQGLESGDLVRTSPNLVPVPPKIDILMDELVVDFCPNHIDLAKLSATIRLDRACGGKFHTRGKYSSGIFSIRMRTPRGAPGVGNSFFISSNDGAPDVISFDFVGNQPNRVITAYAVDGDHAQKQKTFHMSFDTSKEFHQYTIKWDEATIVWMVDEVVIRTLRASPLRGYPRKPGHVYGYTWDASPMAGRVNWHDSPFFMSYGDLQVASPLRPRQWRPPRARKVKRGVPNPIRPLVIDYCPSNIVTQEDHGVEIAFDKVGCGGRVRSLQSYPSGKFSASIKCADGDTSGLLTSFYVSSGEGTSSQDEVDFEFLGDNKQIVQTNFYVNGTSGNEQWVELDFDCSRGFHTYAIHYDQRQIQWFVDARLVRTVVKEEQIRHQQPYPVKNVYLYSSVWNASDVNDGGWTGKWRGTTELPFVAKFRHVTVQYP